MIRLAVSVEGRTEEEFVKAMLADHLRGRGVEPTPILIGRARGGSGGGNVSVERLVPEMRDLYWSFDAVTSLVDFYGFRGRGDRETADELEERLGRAAPGRLPRAVAVMPVVHPARGFPGDPRIKPGSGSLSGIGGVP